MSNNQCLKCSVENCRICYGNLNSNKCISCLSSLIPKYDNYNNISSCEFPNEIEEEIIKIENEEENINKEMESIENVKKEEKEKEEKEIGNIIDEKEYNNSEEEEKQKEELISKEEKIIN